MTHEHFLASVWRYVQRFEYLLQRSQSSFYISRSHRRDGDVTECLILLNRVIVIIKIVIYPVIEQIICKWMLLKCYDYLKSFTLSTYVVVLILQTIIILLRSWPSCGPLWSSCRPSGSPGSWSLWWSRPPRWSRCYLIKLTPIESPLHSLRLKKANTECVTM